MTAVARPAMSRGRAVKSAGSVTNEKKTTEPTQIASARRCTMRRVAVMRDRSSRLLLRGDPLVRSSLHRPAALRPPERQLFDLFRQREVALGDTAGRVRLQLDPEFAPGHLEIGMVVGRLAEEADGVDQHQRRRPAVGAELAADPAFLERPAGKLARQTRGHLAVGDRRQPVGPGVTSRPGAAAWIARPLKLPLSR